MKFPMYLVPLDQLQRLYGGKEPRYDRIEAHQELLRRRACEWIDLPIDAHIIFFHTNGLVGTTQTHGVQLKTFLESADFTPEKISSRDKTYKVFTRR